MMDGNLIKIKCVCAGSELIVQALKNNKFRLTVPCILCPTPHSFTLSSGAFFQKDLFPFSCKFTAINICYIGGSNKVFEAMKQNEEELMKTFAAYEDEYGDDYDGDDFNDFDDFDIFGDDLKDFDGFNDFDGEGFPDLDIFGDLFKRTGSPPPEPEPGFILHKSGANQPDRSALPSSAPAETETEIAPEEIPIQMRSYQITEQILAAVSKLCEEGQIFCRCGDFDGKIVLAGNAVHIECKKCGSYRDVRSVNSSDADYLNEVDELYLDFEE
jgi:hypothetical protein